MQQITSRKNPLILESAKLQDKKYRKKSGTFFIEGKKLFSEALAKKLEIVYAIFSQDAYPQYADCDFSFPVYCVPNEVFLKISTEKSPEGVFCVLKDIDFFHKRYIIYSSDSFSQRKFFICGVRDPGNLGTMIRCACALGIEELILSSDCADLYHPKTVRAAMGTLFCQKISICEKVEDSIALLRQNGYRVLAASLRSDSRNLDEVRIDARTCFVVGNEGHGLDPSVIDACDGSVIIPMKNDTESLNAAMAAGILMWEVAKST